VRLKMAWQQAMFLSHPAVMSGARPLTDEGTQAQMTSFETYARGELETYSERTLELLHRTCCYAGARGEPVGDGLRLPGAGERLRIAGGGRKENEREGLRVQRRALNSQKGVPHGAITKENFRTGCSSLCLHYIC